MFQVYSKSVPVVFQESLGNSRGFQSVLVGSQRRSRRVQGISGCLSRGDKDVSGGFSSDPGGFRVLLNASSWMPYGML